MNDQDSLNRQLADFTQSLGVPDEVIEIITNSVIENQKTEVKGVNIGDKAPDFQLPDTEGNIVSLQKLLKNGPVVISFFRGAWCPYCNVELQALQRNLDLINATGAQLITIHPQRMDASKELRAKHQLGFPVLSDVNQQVIKAFDLKFSMTKEVRHLYHEAFNIDLEELNANGLWNLPVPATYIVDTDGIIKARHFSHDYMVRMEPEDIIRALNNLPNVTPEKHYAKRHRV